MNKFDVQRLLAAAGYYNGSIDGVYGAKSKAAINKVLDGKVPQVKLDSWDLDRLGIAAGQAVLRGAGYEVGTIDGLVGNLTIGGLLQWNQFQTYGKKLELDYTEQYKVTNRTFPRQRDCVEFYGVPGVAIARQLVTVHTPYPMRIDYDLDESTNKVTLHEKCADSAQDAFDEIYKNYGYEKLKELGLDRYAGAYMHRKMRGSDSWSMHAYGCATDWFAGRNGLTTRCPQALFCKPAYQDFFDIWESHGWVSLGRAIGRDWMHIQAARL